MFGDPLERIWRDCLLTYCGFARVERVVFRVIATSTADQRAKWLTETAEMARNLVTGTEVRNDCN